MDVLSNLLMGLSIAMQPMYLLYALAGAILGTITGVLPGLGPLGAMAILLSFTLNIDVTGAMIMFAGIYYGAMYGGSTTSILLNIPGEAASVVTCIDGHKMAQKGRAGAALTIAAVASFVAGTISIFGLTVATTFLAGVALKFGPPEFLAIGVCGLIFIIRLSEAPPLKSLIMALLGMAVATVGWDDVTGVARFTFGIHSLGQGIDFLPVAMGLFGIAEILSVVSSPEVKGSFIRVRFRELLPTIQEWRRSIGPIFRGSFLGFGIGLVPGPSPVIATLVSYFMEKKIAKHPEEFGNGAIEGVAGPEAANNAAVGGAYVPLLALGVPFTPALAVVLGALMLHNVTPGPNLITEHPDLFWSVIASMYVGNLMLLILNLPLVQIFAYVMKIPRPLLYSIIVALCVIGVYSVKSSFIDILVMLGFGVFGYVTRKMGFEPAPLALALVVGPMIETSLRQSLKMTGGDLGAVVTRPICFTLYLVALACIVVPLILKFSRQKDAPTDTKEVN